MKVPLELSFRGIERNDYIDELINDQVAKLEKFCSYISSCRIAVEKTQEYQAIGSPFRVRIDVRIPPGHELVVRRENSGGDLHDQLPMVLREAFQAMRRQVKQLVERQRGETKVHPEQETSAMVVRIFPEEGYGFIQGVDGREVYFHRNAVTHNDFERLEVGTGVHFVEQMGLKGPQASTVQIVDKPGARVRGVSEPEARERGGPPRGWEE